MNRKRLYNLDCLRVLLMCMIVILHFLQQALPGFPEDGMPDTPVLYGAFLKSLCICAVNTFVLLTGYVSTESSFRLSRFVSRVLTLVFYAAGIFLLCYLLGVLTFSGLPLYYRVIQVLFPVSSVQYWYFTAYLLLMLLMPFLNAGLKTLPRRTYEILLCVQLFFHCAVKSLVPVRFALDEHGYDLLWFICLYLVGAYFRTYRMPSFRQGALLYVCSVLLIFALSVALHILSVRTGHGKDFAFAVTDYNFVLTLTAAAGLFAMFVNGHAMENAFGAFCARIAPFLPGVYLLHVHEQLHGRWLSFLRPLLGETDASNLPLLSLKMAGAVLIVMCAGILADMLRTALFYGIGKAAGRT